MALRPSRRRSTIRDVARSAQVSHQTVSRVINGEDCITPRTRARVEQAIAPWAHGVCSRHTQPWERKMGVNAPSWNHRAYSSPVSGIG